MAHHNYVQPTFKKKFTTVQSIVIWLNTITHNLDLVDPQWFQLDLIDATNNTFSISNFLAYTSNSFTRNSAIARPNVHFTVS